MKHIMSRQYRHIFLLLLLTLLCSCDDVFKKKTNWNIDFEKLNKDPYSLYLTYNSLPALFPNAEIEHLKSTSRLNNLGYELRKNKGNSLIIMIGQYVRFNDGEIDSLLSLVEQGHQVLMAVSYFDKDLLDRLTLELKPGQTAGKKELQKIYLKKTADSALAYPFQFREVMTHIYFKNNDSAASPVPFYTLGYNKPDKPECILLSAGKGKLILHSEPMVFSNYFLLRQNNHQYLEQLFGYITEPVTNVYFCSFNFRRVESSDWSVIWANKATRYALLLTLFALGIYLIFEMKRRQKIIPIIPPVENSSVAFVETIGRLYYNKKNHSNLAEKMVQHFLDFVRSNYYLNTNILDEEFVRNLAAKSGQDIAKASTLVYQIKEVQNGVKADEAFLYSLYNQIREFYNGK